MKEKIQIGKTVQTISDECSDCKKWADEKKDLEERLLDFNFCANDNIKLEKEKKELEERVKRIAEHRRKLHVSISNLLTERSAFKKDLIKKVEKFKVEKEADCFNNTMTINEWNSAMDNLINLIKKGE